MKKNEIIIIDVGCRWGFANNFIGKDGEFRVFGFDPDYAECERINKKYNSEYIQAIPVALSGKTGRRKFYLTKEPACGSLFKPKPHLTSNYPILNCMQEVGDTLIDTLTLDDWISANDVHYVDHIKLDTQGSELEILQGAEDILNTVRSIEVEVQFNPLYEGLPVFSEVDIYLRKKGFVLWKLSNLVHYSQNKIPGQKISDDVVCYDNFQYVATQAYSGQLFWANAHYVRSEVVNADEAYPDAAKVRDINLFSALGMSDVVFNIKANS